MYDSIFLDVPMGRVKFNAHTEYAYLENFKILSSTFRKHHIDRPIPVEQLVKCKMQDNLEFLQWSKRYWDQYFPGGDYDAVSRRKATGPSAAPAAAAPSSRPAPASKKSGTGAAALRTSSRQAGSGATSSLQQQQKMAELQETVQGLERERDFYFSKLRDIELLIQQAMEADPSLEEDENGLLKQIQAILYSTEVRSFPHVLAGKTESGLTRAHRRDSRFLRKPRPRPWARKRRFECGRPKDEGECFWRWSAVSRASWRARARAKRYHYRIGQRGGHAERMGERKASARWHEMCRNAAFWCSSNSQRPRWRVTCTLRSDRVAVTTVGPYFMPLKCRPRPSVISQPVTASTSYDPKASCDFRPHIHWSGRSPSPDGPDSLFGAFPWTTR